MKTPLRGSWSKVAFFSQSSVMTDLVRQSSACESVRRVSLDMAANILG